MDSKETVDISLEYSMNFLFDIQENLISLWQILLLLLRTGTHKDPKLY